MKKLLLTLFIVLLCSNLAPAWGTFAHRTVTQLAVYALPANLRAYYFRHMPALVNGSAGGNEARERDIAESPRHFISMDHYGTDPFGIMPKEWEKAAAKYTADTLRKYGTLPWAVIDTKNKLTTAFRDADTTAILTLSAELSHLVADAYVPLRTTENYDGQLSKQEGLLALWESKLPEQFIGKYKLKNEPARPLKDPLADIWQVVQESYGFLGATFDYEEKTTRKFTPQTKYVFSHKYGETRRAYSDAFAEAYHADQIGGMIAFRLKLAPTLVASMWLTAWKDAGSPDLNKLLKRPVSKEEKEQLDTQLSAWKDNVLVDQKSLLALEPMKAEVRPDLINAARDMPTLSPDMEAKAPAAAPAPTAPATAAAPATTKVKTKVKPADGPVVKEKAKPAAKPAAKPKPKAKAKADDGWGSPAGSGW
ncbi:phospholipase C/P1 nuclease family protein [Hymenobacter aerophilus]|uniref:hypothetical protein n=1 Tax=Hymenobacter aerophilus TaxID=119644 RepID=UPI0003666676|nr:hypothetical protein [Hymenobacter aerophilus]